MTDYLAGPGYVLERRRVTRLIQTFSFGQFRSNVLYFYTPRKLQMQLKREHISNKNLNAVSEATKKAAFSQKDVTDDPANSQVGIDGSC